MASLRYVAFLCDDPPALAEFYQRFLGTEELGRSMSGDISITDGFYNLTFFKRRAALGEMRMDVGLHHIGVEVDDLEAVKGRFLGLNPRGMILQEPNDIHHGEIRIHDPECLPVSLSTKAFGVPRNKETPGYVARILGLMSGAGVPIPLDDPNLLEVRLVR